MTSVKDLLPYKTKVQVFIFDL